MPPEPPPPPVAILRRPDGQPWPPPVLAVRTPATLSLGLDPAELVITATATQDLAVTVATLDSCAATHGVSYEYLVDGLVLGRGGALPGRRAGAVAMGEDDEGDGEG
jgi:hypothetical protein